MRCIRFPSRWVSCSYPWVEHTNFLKPEYFGGDYILYIGDYLEVTIPTSRRATKNCWRTCCRIWRASILNSNRTG